MINITKLAREICLLHLQDDQASEIASVITALANSAEELNYYAGLNVISEEFDLTGSFVLQMPEHCIRPIKAGVYCDGKLVLLGYNQSIAFDPENHCSCTENSVCEFHTFHNYGDSAYTEYYEAYGYRHNQFPTGYWNWQHQGKKIKFSSGEMIYDGAKIVVEYVSSLKKDATIAIDAKYKPILTYHALSLYFMGRDPNKSAFYRQQLRNSSELLKRAERPSLVDIVGVIRGGAYLK